ncbi:hypothetical protein [Tsukamurella sp. 1534]|uniref:hypothetical protein n=1 Tax=Tsukamurella sp. 1534 TaxID=1151061 RepID=UPI0002EE6914|nr:hypothetical protein [Tsukamurella sp. 1534]
MAISAFGASVGRGPVHCVLIDIEDGRIVGQQTRTIDPGPYHLGRRGELLTSGFDLLSTHSERSVEAAGVATRTRRDVLSVRYGTSGDIRSAGIVPESDALMRALDEQGVIARYPVALIADLGADGLRVHTVADGAVSGDRHTWSASVTGPEPGPDTAHAAAEFIRTVAAESDRKPEALALVGAGAQHESIREAVSDAARAAGMEPVTVEDPEAVAATGAALVAADRRAAGAAAFPRRAARFGAFGGHSVRLTAAVLPVLVLAALTAAVLAASYATGIIGPTGDSSERTPASSSYVQVSDSAPSDTGRPLPVSSTLPPPETTLPPEPTAPQPTAPRTDQQPVITTFAPAPTPTSTVPKPTTTVPSTRPTTPTPSTTLPPTELLPTIPTPSGGPSSGPSGERVPGSPAPGAGSSSSSPRPPGAGGEALVPARPEQPPRVAPGVVATPGGAVADQAPAEVTESTTPTIDGTPAPAPEPVAADPEPTVTVPAP